MIIEIKLLTEKLSPLLDFVSGNEGQKIQGISSPSQAKEGYIVFANNEKAIDQVLNSPVAAIVVAKNHLELVKPFKGTVLTSPHVYLAMAQVGKYFFPITKNRQPFDGERIHPTAVISSSATISDSAIIHPHATIGANSVIGDNCFVGAGTTIEPDSQVGENTFLHAQVAVAHGTVIGKDCEIHPQTSLGTEGFGYAQDQHFNHHRITHYGKLILGDRVHIGAGCTIDRGTFEDSHIQSGVITDNLCHFGHNFKCGENTIFVGGNMVAGSVTIGSRCVFGGRTTIAGHLSICDNVQVSGMSGVTKSIIKPGQYGGYPVQPHKKNLRTLASLPSVPEMRKTLANLVNKVDTLKS